ncbi:sugar ABC transporter permease [Pseudaminobacter sp. 19-2017]|uniref:Sugar ABC transporter permease n=1 Tax=Pseudaminobacter soli (ex Zhang et al. 2022) TaxID=2831468 RepID=A0A942DWS5_9HYPH|nr:sugar ABC transporter permease [Pseudaminobacter soli]MBS3648493.1 sugar ABC transporter permease [Pseudaminobacter soli]
MTRTEQLASLPPIELMMREERRRARRRLWTALAFMSPALIFVGVFLLLPVAFNVYASMTKWAKFSGLDQYAGLANYQRLLSNPNFSTATGNTILWVVASFFLPAMLGLALALLVKGLKGEETFKSIYFLPRMFSATAVGVVWYYVYANEGILNSGLRAIGLEGLTRRWLYEEGIATPAMIVTHIWQQVGLTMVLLLLGLNALPSEPIEAAKVDGASRWGVFRHIVLPLLAPTILVVATVSVLAGFTSFDLVWVMGRDFPNRSTLTLAVNQYWESFRAGYWGYGAAIAVVLGVIAFSISWLLGALQQRLDRR